MNKTYQETFPKDGVDEEQIKALCAETKAKVIGCQSCTYASSSDGKSWIVTTVVKMLS